MNAPDPPSDTAWMRILPQIRKTRSARRQRKIVITTTLCAMLGIWLGMRLSNPPENPPGPPLAHATPPPTPPATLTVMRVSHDGTVRLEELAGDELGQLELTLSLSPVIASAFQE
jgi:hypothetical protein